jgi:hypothetical protein
MKLDEQAIQECLNKDNDAPLLQLTDSEMVHILLHPNKGADTDD